MGSAPRRFAAKPSWLSTTDLFCGAGGSSIGAAAAGADLRMGLNHWKLAVDTHAENFPGADHDCTDASSCDPARYPSTQVLLASPECTNHSLAKGQKRRGAGQSDLFHPASQDPANVRSRATMWDVPRFAERHRYELVIVENVPDVRMWDPYPAWLQAMHCLGYQHREVWLNSMFAHPTPQSRDRVYVVFWRKGNPAPDLELRPAAHCPRCGDVEAVQSWKAGRSWGRYRRQYVYCCPTCTAVVDPYYYAALNAIDWSLPAERIRDRRRPLKERTLGRIRYGLEKYGRQPLVVRTNMTSGVECRVRAAAGEPLDTQPGSSITGLVAPPLLIQTRHVHGLGHRVRDTTRDPLPTQTADLDNGVAFPPSFVMTYRNYEGAAGYPVASLSDPLRTIVAHTQERLVINGAALLSMRDWSGAPLVRHLGQPLPTQIANGPQEGIASLTPYLVSYYGKDGGDEAAGSIAGPMGTLSTIDRHALVDPEEELLNSFFRMLQPHEIGRGMAFPDWYRVLGTKRDRTKLYGNAVTPPAMALLVGRCAETLGGRRVA